MHKCLFIISCLSILSLKIINKLFRAGADPFFLLKKIIKVLSIVIKYSVKLKKKTQKDYIPFTIIQNIMPF